MNFKQIIKVFFINVVFVVSTMMAAAVPAIYSEIDFQEDSLFSNLYEDQLSEQRSGLDTVKFFETEIIELFKLCKPCMKNEDIKKIENSFAFSRKNSSIKSLSVDQIILFWNQFKLFKKVKGYKLGLTGWNDTYQAEDLYKMREIPFVIDLELALLKQAWNEDQSEGAEGKLDILDKMIKPSNNFKLFNTSEDEREALKEKRGTLTNVIKTDIKQMLESSVGAEDSKLFERAFACCLKIEAFDGDEETESVKKFIGRVLTSEELADEKYEALKEIMDAVSDDALHNQLLNQMKPLYENILKTELEELELNYKKLNDMISFANKVGWQKAKGLKQAKLFLSTKENMTDFEEAMSQILKNKSKAVQESLGYAKELYNCVTKKDDVDKEFKNLVQKEKIDDLYLNVLSQLLLEQKLSSPDSSANMQQVVGDFILVKNSLRCNQEDVQKFNNACVKRLDEYQLHIGASRQNYDAGRMKQHVGNRNAYEEFLKNNNIIRVSHQVIFDDLFFPVQAEKDKRIERLGEIKQELDQLKVNLEQFQQDDLFDQKKKDAIVAALKRLKDNQEFHKLALKELNDWDEESVLPSIEENDKNLDSFKEKYQQEVAYVEAFKAADNPEAKDRLKKTLQSQINLEKVDQIRWNGEDYKQHCTKAVQDLFEKLFEYYQVGKPVLNYNLETELVAAAEVLSFEEKVEIIKNEKKKLFALSDGNLWDTKQSFSELKKKDKYQLFKKIEEQLLIDIEFQAWNKAKSEGLEAKLDILDRMTRPSNNFKLFDMPENEREALQEKRETLTNVIKTDIKGMLELIENPKLFQRAFACCLKIKAFDGDQEMKAVESFIGRVLTSEELADEKYEALKEIMDTISDADLRNQLLNQIKPLYKDILKTELEKPELNYEKLDDMIAFANKVGWKKGEDLKQAKLFLSTKKDMIVFEKVMTEILKNKSKTVQKSLEEAKESYNCVTKKEGGGEKQFKNRLQKQKIDDLYLNVLSHLLLKQEISSPDSSANANMQQIVMDIILAREALSCCNQENVKKFNAACVEKLDKYKSQIDSSRKNYDAGRMKQQVDNFNAYGEFLQNNDIVLYSDPVIFNHQLIPVQAEKNRRIAKLGVIKQELDQLKANLEQFQQDDLFDQKKKDAIVAALKRLKDNQEFHKLALKELNDWDEESVLPSIEENDKNLDSFKEKYQQEVAYVEAFKAADSLEEKDRLERVLQSQKKLEEVDQIRWNGEGSRRHFTKSVKDLFEKLFEYYQVGKSVLNYNLETELVAAAEALSFEEKIEIIKNEQKKLFALSDGTFWSTTRSFAELKVDEKYRLFQTLEDQLISTLFDLFKKDGQKEDLNLVKQENGKFSNFESAQILLKSLSEGKVSLSESDQSHFDLLQVRVALLQIKNIQDSFSQGIMEESEKVLENAQDLKNLLDGLIEKDDPENMYSKYKEDEIVTTFDAWKSEMNSCISLHKKVERAIARKNKKIVKKSIKKLDTTSNGSYVSKKVAPVKKSIKILYDTWRQGKLNEEILALEAGISEASTEEEYKNLFGQFENINPEGYSKIEKKIEDKEKKLIKKGQDEKAFPDVIEWAEKRKEVINKKAQDRSAAEEQKNREREAKIEAAAKKKQLKEGSSRKKQFLKAAGALFIVASPLLVFKAWKVQQRYKKLKAEFQKNNPDEIVDRKALLKQALSEEFSRKCFSESMQTIKNKLQIVLFGNDDEDSFVNENEEDLQKIVNAEVA